MRSAALIVLAVLIAGGATALHARGADGPTPAEPVIVAGERLTLGPGKPAVAADRATERAWLAGEARERGLPSDGDVRAAVADALADEKTPFAAAFAAFHARWRARTTGLAGFADPYSDRCSNLAPAPAGTCLWLGEARLCAAGKRWLVIRSPDTLRVTAATLALLPPRLRGRVEGRVTGVRSRAAAVTIARAAYDAARARRERAAEKARLARERAARIRDPRLSESTLAAARGACAAQQRASDPYLFGFGLQDVVGQAEGLIAARSDLAVRLARTGDAIDRVKLHALTEAIAGGTREFVRLGAADARSDHELVAEIVARLDARTEPERAIAQRLGLGDCLARPAR